MFKIGDFARLTGVSVPALHHYDDIGLFKPLHVDRFTGYRYYSFEQLPRLNRILALRDLGFSLEQIARLLDEPLSVEQLDGMLMLRRAELQEQMMLTLERLARVEARLSQIRMEGKMPMYEVILKQVEPIKIVGAREIVPKPEQMRERCIALINEVCALLDAKGVQSTETSLALYHDSTEAGIDVEMAMLLPPDAPSEVMGLKHGRAVVRELPGVKAMATVVYHGSYDDFKAVGQLHADIGRWIEANGYRIVGANREIYLQAPQQSGGDGVMEIQYPVEKQ